MRKPKNFEKSKKSKYHKVYWNLYADLRKKDIKIFHRQMKDVALCDFINKIIFINSEISGTIMGVIALYHEWKHILDFQRKKYQSFYRCLQYAHYPSPNSDMILKVEWNCFKFAQTNLYKRGFFVKNRYFNKSILEKTFLPAWESGYKKTNNQ